MAYIVFFEDNWADEMDIVGFKLMTDDTHKEWKKNLKKIGDNVPIEVSFGTNQSNEYDSPDDFKDCFTSKKISDEEMKAVAKVFGKNQLYNGKFGRFPNIEDFINDE